MISEQTHKILFVCMGNICRSPAGECVMRHMANEADLGERLLCDSAGTISMHTGNAPDDRMQAAGKRRDITIEGAARHVKAEDLEKFDLILAMDAENLEYLQHLPGADLHAEKIQLFCDYCENFSESEVPDPYYGGKQGFEHVLDLLEDGCATLIERMR